MVILIQKYELLTNNGILQKKGGDLEVFNYFIFRFP